MFGIILRRCNFEATPKHTPLQLVVPLLRNHLHAVCAEEIEQTEFFFLSFSLLLCPKLVAASPHHADQRCWYDISHAATIMFVGVP